ncbi:lymphocyte antigen 6B-like [Scyliorhinus canicula]|uniref:lymphocyte antigen 6B-like n=1 Tax=Scyliorhinus canicula TaxID=7830 RepID=UPI0018F3FBBF|nr:lymphocyte antigen 6B-like [Scyliorhinus canicula]
MRSLLLFGCVLVACVSLAASLRCFHCALSFGKCISGAKNCTNPAELCFERVGKAGKVSVYNSGCTLPANCNKTLEQSFQVFTVSLNTRCCNVDLCNGSGHLQSSLPLSIVLALLCLAGLR